MPNKTQAAPAGARTRKAPRAAAAAPKKAARAPRRKNPQVAAAPAKKQARAAKAPFLEAAIAGKASAKQRRAASADANGPAAPARARVGELSAAALGELTALEAMIPAVLDRVAMDLRDRAEALRTAIRRAAAQSSAEEDAAPLAESLEKTALRLMQLRMEKEETPELLDRISRRLEKSRRRIAGK